VAEHSLVLAAALHTQMCLLLLGLTCRALNGLNCCFSIIVAAFDYQLVLIDE
jgi:hypothetical protein